MTRGKSAAGLAESEAMSNDWTDEEISLIKARVIKGGQPVEVIGRIESAPRRPNHLADAVPAAFRAARAVEPTAAELACGVCVRRIEAATLHVEIVEIEDLRK